MIGVDQPVEIEITAYEVLERAHRLGVFGETRIKPGSHEWRRQVGTFLKLCRAEACRQGIQTKDRQSHFPASVYPAAVKLMKTQLAEEAKKAESPDLATMDLVDPS